MSREVTLPSGAVLTIQPAPFADARDLYQALMEEGKGLKLDPTAEVDVNFWKDLFCTGLSSKKVEQKLWKCMEKVLINKLRVTTETFEPVEARDDYFTVLMEVATENISPFTKSLYVKYADILRQITSFQASKSQTTPS